MDRAVVLYDEDCGFCRWATGRVLAWDRRNRIRAVALQDPEAERLLPGIDHERRMASWHVLGPDGRVWSAGRAAAPLLRLLPAGAPLAALAAAFPRTTDRLYDWTARHRGRLGALLGARRCAVQPSGKRDERSTRRA
ncbi:MAG TPA: DCC1-like thiol-disulfide oxidoreductase family protein [Actinomycetota bacterium]|nr:DCC1-like thiol-disulfide oxidoreductase family protein [Actinomycetota bacterium]